MERDPDRPHTARVARRQQLDLRDLQARLGDHLRQMRRSKRQQTAGHKNLDVPDLYILEAGSATRVDSQRSFQAGQLLAAAVPLAREHFAKLARLPVELEQRRLRLGHGLRAPAHADLAVTHRLRDGEIRFAIAVERCHGRHAAQFRKRWLDALRRLVLDAVWPTEVEAVDPFVGPARPIEARLGHQRLDSAAKALEVHPDPSRCVED
eukprot:2771920-Rhodomonas_salina.1